MPKPKRIRLAIGTATTGLCRIEWVESLIESVKMLKTKKYIEELGIDDVALFYFCSSVIPKNRNEVVKMAQQWGATHILWIDDDMGFGAEVVRGILLVNQKLDKADPENAPKILGANCIKRLYPLQYMAAGFDNREVLSYASKGIVEVKFTGNAFLLTDMCVYDKIPQPWFAFPWVPETQDIGTEDVYFMSKAREYGYGTYVIHELGEYITHTGPWTFKPSDRASGRGHSDVPDRVRVGGDSVGDLPVAG